MKNLENVKALNDMEMAMVAGGGWLHPTLNSPNGCLLEKANGCFLVKPPKTSGEEHLTRRGKC